MSLANLNQKWKPATRQRTKRPTGSHPRQVYPFDADERFTAPFGNGFDSGNDSDSDDSSENGTEGDSERGNGGEGGEYERGRDLESLALSASINCSASSYPTTLEERGGRWR